MSTAITISPELMEQVVVTGDLSRLTPTQRLDWYRHRCEAAGLDPRTQPFQYLQLQGKLTLYATKACTDQLIASRGLDIRLGERRFDQRSGIAEQTAIVRRPDGSVVEDVGALPIGELRGEALANAIMKLATKAKRRTVLSACGLGMLDESELDTIRDARRVETAEVHAERPALPPKTKRKPSWREQVAAASTPEDLDKLEDAIETSKLTDEQRAELHGQIGQRREALEITEKE